MDGGIHAAGGALALNTGDNSQVSATTNVVGTASPLKAELDRLTQLVNELAKQLDPEAAQEAQECLKVLKEQAAKPKPNPRWYEVSAEGLKDAAKAVASIGPDVVKSVTTVLKLLTGTGT